MKIWSDLVTKLSYFDSEHKSKSNQVGEGSNQVQGKSNQVDEESNQVEADLVTTRQLQLTNKQKDIWISALFHALQQK